MRVNVYAEEITDRVEIVEKTIDGKVYTGVRFYLELPATGPDGEQFAAPFIHRTDDAGNAVDDDSAAVTFWGKKKLRLALEKALELLGGHRPSTSGIGADMTAERAIRELRGD